jgi:hypothetical protein
MDFNLTHTSLQRLIDEEALVDQARLQELAEPSGVPSPFPYGGDVLVRLKQELNEIFQTVDGEWTSSSTKWQPIDAQASVAIHRTLSKLPRDIAMSKGFWRYLSVYCASLVCKRYGYVNTKTSFDKRHFGEEIYNSFIPRLWFRAELSLDEEAEDPYWLTKKGVSDFWSSFVLRRTYAQSRPLIRALVKYFFVPENVCFYRDDVSITTLEAFRLLGPAVRRQHSLSPFELMGEGDCTATIDLLASEMMIRRAERED